MHLARNASDSAVQRVVSGETVSSIEDNEKRGQGAQRAQVADAQRPVFVGVVLDGSYFVDWVAAVGILQMSDGVTFTQTS